MLNLAQTGHDQSDPEELLDSYQLNLQWLQHYCLNPVADNILKLSNGRKNIRFPFPILELHWMKYISPLLVWKVRSTVYWTFSWNYIEDTFQRFILRLEAVIVIDRCSDDDRQGVYCTTVRKWTNQCKAPLLPWLLIAVWMNCQQQGAKCHQDAWNTP